MILSLTDSIKGTLKDLGVGVVYLIGSHARGTANALSDVDFAVVMKNKKAFRDTEALYQELYGLFSDAVLSFKGLKTVPSGILSLDIVFLDTAPLYYALAARDSGQILFEISPDFRAHFEEQATLKYADFEPLRREQEKVTLKMI